MKIVARNQNRPKKGDQIKVEPIRKRKDIENIKKLLADNARDSALLTLGINTNLRASDLLKIRAGQVRDLKPGDSIQLKEKKTGKFRMVTLNKACIQAIQRLLASRLTFFSLVNRTITWVRRVSIYYFSERENVSRIHRELANLH